MTSSRVWFSSITTTTWAGCGRPAPAAGVDGASPSSIPARTAVRRAIPLTPNTCSISINFPMSANPAFDALRELLARPPEPLPGDDVLPSGIPTLDQALAGGFPRGAIVTFEGPPTSGASALAARLLAQATHEGLGALLQSEGRLSAVSLAAAGIKLERLAIIPVDGALGIVRAADILVRAGTFSVVVIPVPQRVRGIGAAAWNRLSGLAQRTRTILIASGTEPPEELCA